MEKLLLRLLLNNTQVGLSNINFNKKAFIITIMKAFSMDKTLNL